MSEPIVVVPYDEAWKQEFQAFRRIAPAPKKPIPLSSRLCLAGVRVSVIVTAAGGGGEIDVPGTIDKHACRERLSKGTVIFIDKYHHIIISLCY